MIAQFFRKLVSKQRAGNPAEEPRLPAGVRVYAIGDIHGRIDLLERLYAMIEAHRKDRPIGHCVEVFLGDYIDRGPSSKEVLEWMVNGPNVSNKRITLRGNHELYLQDFLGDPGVISAWGQYGGLETLNSYGLKFRMPIKQDQWGRYPHRAFGTPCRQAIGFFWKTAFCQPGQASIFSHTPG